MRWDCVAAPAEKIVLAQALVHRSAREGWNRNMFNAASRDALGAGDAWRALFPAGARDAIWFISEISDASMRAAFAIPALDMSAVITERLQQNTHLKPFVRRVMLFDVVHPVQAIARMQRTARVMIACISPSQPVGAVRTTLLNWAYTLVVFVWLFDWTRSDEITGSTTRVMMRALAL